MQESKAAEALRKLKEAKEREQPSAEVAALSSEADYGIRRHDYVMHWYAYYISPKKTAWRRVTVQEIKDYLGCNHQIGDIKENGLPSLADIITQRAVQNWSVAYAGNFAGYLEMGEYPTPNGTLLITRGRKLLEANKGNCRFLLNFLRRAFKRPQQFYAFCGWMRWAVLSLLQPVGRWSHGHALLIVGDTDIGKTTLQNDVIDPLLTNNRADASHWLKGGSFNAQLGEAEHWLMSDPKSSSKKEQDEFLAGLKEAIANVWMFIHPKGKTPIDLPTYRRLTITLNREERALRIVSDLAESEAEKLLMLDFEDAGRYAPNGKGGLEYAEWKEKILSQLPAFKYWLLNEFELPSDMTHSRFGVRYTNPELHQRLIAPTQEQKDAELDGMIVDACFVEQTSNVHRVIHWQEVKRVELTAGQVIDRSICDQNIRLPIGVPQTIVFLEGFL
jgi:hypothetical protein